MQGNYTLWIEVIKLVSFIFLDVNGNFKSERKQGNQWKTYLVKFCSCVVHSFPQAQNICTNDCSELEVLRNHLFYIKNTFQPYFSSKRFSTKNVDKKVNKEK